MGEETSTYEDMYSVRLKLSRACPMNLEKVSESRPRGEASKLDKLLTMLTSRVRS